MIVGTSCGWTSWTGARPAVPGRAYRSPWRPRRRSRGLRLGRGRRRPRRAVAALGRLLLPGIAGLLEDDDVLPGEELQRVLEGEPLGLDLAADLLEGHLVLGLDGDLGVLAAELDEDQAAAGLERGE